MPAPTHLVLDGRVPLQRQPLIGSYLVHEAEQQREFAVVCGGQEETAELEGLLGAALVHGGHRQTWTRRDTHCQCWLSNTNTDTHSDTLI